MRTWSRQVVGVMVAAGGIFSLVAGAGAETFTLQLKRLELLKPSQGVPTVERIYRSSRPQHFYMQTGVKRTASASFLFSRVVTKEPAKYRSEHPFRGMAKLGSAEYGFVLDTKDRESKQYSRLYFDVNHNGDLTDDGVFEGKQPEGKFPEGYWWCRFPRIDTTIDVDGQQVEYAFFLNASSAFMGGSADARFVSATLQTAVYREGEIKLNGKTRRIALVDFNSNGRFDDQVSVRQSSSGRASPVYGDLLLLDPDPGDEDPSLGYNDLAECQVAKLAHIDGDLYDLSVSAGGDKITLAPSSLPLGHVTLPADGFRAAVYSDKGLLNLRGDKSKPVPLPAGDWKLISYTIDQSGYEKSAGEEEGKPKGRSLLQTLADALVGAASSSLSGSTVSRSRSTLISTYGAEGSKVIKVREGRTVALPFGPPYKPVVTAPAGARGGQKISLGLSLVGLGGEVCSSLIVDGTRPEEPTFTISTAKGEEVESGKFKWG